MGLLGTNRATFSINLVDKFQDTFSGSFTTKIFLTAEETIAEAVIADQLSGGSKSLNEGMKNFNNTIASLDVYLTDAPEWWRKSRGGRDLLDPKTIFEVSTKMWAAVAQYQENLQKQIDNITAATKAEPPQVAGV